MSTARLKQHTSSNLLSKIAALPITSFTAIMGLTGLALACKSSFPQVNLALHLASSLGILASICFSILVFAYLSKIIVHRKQVNAELKHPVLLNFFPTISISFLLLSLFWQTLPALSASLWVVGASLQFLLTLHIVSVWMFKHHFSIEQLNPTAFIPLVGNLLVPLNVEHSTPWISGLFFAIGMVLGVIVFAFVLYRLFFVDNMPQPLQPSYFILLAAPSVSFLAYISISNEVTLFASVLYNLALFIFVLLAFNIKRFLQQNFIFNCWAYAFPLAAFILATAKLQQYQADVFLTVITSSLTIILVVLALWLSMNTIKNLVKALKTT